MKVLLEQIEIYAGTQVRQSIDDETVTQYAERMMEGDVFPPVVLFHDGTVYYIGDGFHRVLGSERNGFIDIEADVRKGTQQDALVRLGRKQDERKAHDLRRLAQGRRTCVADMA